MSRREFKAHIDHILDASLTQRLQLDVADLASRRCIKYALGFLSDTLAILV